MDHKIRHALAEREANYKLAGLIELDDTYFGAQKPGKRGRGARGKTKASKPLPAEFCYRFNRHFWNPQMFNRMLPACLNTATITFAELRT